MSNGQNGNDRSQGGDFQGDAHGPEGGIDRPGDSSADASGSDVGRIAGNGLEANGERDSESVRDSTLGHRVSMTHMEVTSGPLPPAAELERYERILPGAADRILSMAERSLQSEIEGQRDVRRIYAEDRRAENWCLKFTSAVFSLLVVAVFIVTVVFWAMGMNAQAILSAACFVLCLLPRVIDAIKGRKTGDNMAPPSDGGDASAE